MARRRESYVVRANGYRNRGVFRQLRVDKAQDLHHKAFPAISRRGPMGDARKNPWGELMRSRSVTATTVLMMASLLLCTASPKADNLVMAPAVSTCTQTFQPWIRANTVTFQCASELLIGDKNTSTVDLCFVSGTAGYITNKATSKVTIGIGGLGNIKCRRAVSPNQPHPSESSSWPTYDLTPSGFTALQGGTIDDNAMAASWNLNAVHALQFCGVYVGVPQVPKKPSYCKTCGFRPYCFGFLNTRAFGNRNGCIVVVVARSSA